MKNRKENENKNEEIGMFKLLLFIYKKYYVETKHQWQILTLFVLTFLQSIYPLIYSYILGRIIDNITQSYNTGVGFESLIPTIVVGVTLTFVWIITNNLFNYIETITDIWVPYLDDEVYLNKYTQIEPKAYENPDFINKKSTLAWNT